MVNIDFQVEEFWIPTNYAREYPGATRDGKQNTLWMAAKRLKPVRSNSTPIAKQNINIVFAGGNGFPKELYEPMLQEIFTRLATGGIGVEACYILDMVSQGASGRRNEKLLGDEPSIRDYAIDILHVIRHENINPGESPLLAIGHSIGGTAIVHLAALHPRIFRHMTLIEPMIMTDFGDGMMVTLFSHATISKLVGWPSREAAEEYFQKNMPYRSWDPRVRTRMLRHGVRLRPGGDGAVELVTSKHQEAITFARPTNAEFSKWELPAIEAAFALLPFLRPPTSFVFGGRSMLLTLEKRADTMSTIGTGVGGSGGAAAGMVTEAVVEKGGHTIPLDAVDQCAEHVASAILVALSKDVNADGRSAQRSFEPGTSEVSEAWRAGVKKGVNALRKSRIKGVRL